MDEILTDEQISEMLEKIKSSFGEGEEETITENSYSFKNRAGNMIDSLDYLKGEKGKASRIYEKSMCGYDE